MKIYCNVYSEYRKSKHPKISSIFKKALGLSIVYGKCGHEYKKMFKEKKSIEILKILGLIRNIEENPKIYNHV